MPAPVAGNSEDEAASYRIFVRDLVVGSSLGIYPHERGLRRRVRVGAELLVGQAISGRDDFAEVLNYETIVGGIKSIAEAGHLNLVESVGVVLERRRGT
jgi:dihydroneopterin aldolase